MLATSFANDVARQLLDLRKNWTSTRNQQSGNTLESLPVTAEESACLSLKIAFFEGGTLVMQAFATA